MTSEDTPGNYSIVSNYSINLAKIVFSNTFSHFLTYNMKVCVLNYNYQGNNQNPLILIYKKPLYVSYRCYTLYQIIHTLSYATTAMKLSDQISSLCTPFSTHRLHIIT